MIEHGIQTTEATYWVHLFPLESTAYWYRVDHMRKYINRHGLLTTIGRSKNGAETGAGFLVPKSAYCVMFEMVPPSYCQCVDWKSLSDRETGALGEDIIEVLIEHDIIRFPAARAVRLTETSNQYSGMDFAVDWMQKATIEAKTERYYSRNLFVQARERGHNPNLIRHADGAVVESNTRADWDRP